MFEELASTLGGKACLVFDLADVREKGFYHHMRDIHVLEVAVLKSRLD